MKGRRECRGREGKVEGKWREGGREGKVEGEKGSKFQTSCCYEEHKQFIEMVFIG